MADATEMSFFEHLAELRQRLIYAALAIFVASIVSLIWAGELFSFFTAPMRHSFPNAQLIGTGPAEALLVKLQVGFAAGIVLALPVSFYQLWRFVAPGLHDHERKLAVPFVLFGVLFFLCGAAFCFFIVLPVAFHFFSGEFTSIDLLPQIRIREYLSFTLRLVLVFGLVFDLPVVSYVLARAGLLTSALLRKQLRMAIVIIFIVAGVLTPPDVVSQLLLALPLLALYALCIWVSAYAERARRGSATSPTG